MCKKMPVLFVGHGSPMNAIENNDFTRGWEEIAARIPRPTAILAISAHWYTPGTRINDSAQPKTVYDMYGFPDELYRIVYHAPGAPELAHQTNELLLGVAQIDNSWGIDHGTWSVLHRMYPQADIPVFQLSVNQQAPAEEHYRLGQQLQALREQGVLIFGSGNVVHNLGRIDWQSDGGYPWAERFDAYIKAQILAHQHQHVIDYHTAGESAQLAFVTPEHFYPLLYVLGASAPDDAITVFNDACTLGALSKTSYLFAPEDNQ